MAQQNLVPNPSFETGSPCDDSYIISTIEHCDDWFDAFSSVDWFSNCYCGNIATDFYCPPNIFYGNSVAHTGNSFIGFVPYYENTDYSEVPGVKLIEPLKADSAYCISIWVKNSYNHDTDYHIYNFDCVFLNDTTGNLQDPSNPFPQQFSFTPQSNLNNAERTNDWVELKGDYIAIGGESYLLFGVLNKNQNFYNLGDNSTPEERMYYFFDDISIYQCDKDSIANPSVYIPNVFTPNNDGLNDYYELNFKNIKSLKVTIFNRWGNVVAEFDGLTSKWDGNFSNGQRASEGVYFVKVSGIDRLDNDFVDHGFFHLVR